MIFQRSLLAMTALCVPFQAASAGVLRDHEGHWMGQLALPNGEAITSGVDIFRRADGSTWASLAMVDQGTFDIPVTRVIETGSDAHIELSFGAFDLKWKHDHFEGHWTQGDHSLPISLRQVAGFPRKTRMQTPVPPYPYRSEDIAISSTDGVTLGATLSVPNGVERPNLVVLVAGSGPMTRDEDVEGHQLFAVLADQLLRRGIAVLRYDKRGVARSTGDYASHTELQLQQDLEAILASLKRRRQFGRIGVVGHSEGPMIAAAVAGRRPTSVEFLVSMAGVGLPGLDVLLLQDRLAAKDRGATPEEVERLALLGHRFYDIVLEQPDPSARRPALEGYRSNLPSTDAALIKKYGMDSGSLSVEQAVRPALRAILLSDPREDWRRVKCPVLALHGSLDHQVPTQSLDGIRQALVKGGNYKVETALLPSLNHLFQTAQSGADEEYASIEETISPLAIERIAKFILQR